MAPRLIHIALFAVALTASASITVAQNNNDRQRVEEAQRRQLENLRREVRDLERTVKQVEEEIESRQKQLADAPKTINPAEKALKEAEQRQEKAGNVIAGLRKRVDDAQAKELNVLRSLKSEFAGADELDAAEAKLEASIKRMDQARESGVAKLAKDARYKAAHERVETARIRIDVLNEQREAGRVSSTDVADAGTLLFQFQKELDAMEARVLADNEAYQQASKEVEEARKTLAYLRAQMIEKVKTNPEYAQAEKELAQAREAFGEATREVAEAGKARAEASGTLSRLKAQVQEFERDTQRLKSRREVLQSQLRAKERRVSDYARSIRR